MSGCTECDSYGDGEYTLPSGTRTSGMRIFASTYYGPFPDGSYVPAMQILIDTGPPFGSWKCWTRNNIYADGIGGDIRDDGSVGWNSVWTPRDCDMEQNDSDTCGSSTVTYDFLQYEGDSAYTGCGENVSVGGYGATVGAAMGDALTTCQKVQIYQAYEEANDRQREWQAEYGDRVRATEQAAMENGSGKFAQLSGCSTSSDDFDSAIDAWDETLAAMAELTAAMYRAEIRARSAIQYLSENDVGPWKRGTGVVPLNLTDYTTITSSGGHLFGSDSDWRWSNRDGKEEYEQALADMMDPSADPDVTTDFRGTCREDQNPFRCFAHLKDEGTSHTGASFSGQYSSGTTSPYCWRVKYTGYGPTSAGTSWNTDAYEAADEIGPLAMLNDPQELLCSGGHFSASGDFTYVQWPSHVPENVCTQTSNAGPEGNATPMASAGIDWFDGSGNNMSVVWREAADTTLGEEYLNSDDNEGRAEFKEMVWLYYKLAQTYEYVMGQVKPNLSEAQQGLCEALITSIGNYKEGLAAIERLMMTLEDRLCLEAGENLWLAERAQAWSVVHHDYDLNSNNGDTLRVSARRLRASAASREGLDISSLGTANVPPFFEEQCFLLAEIPYLVEYKKRILEYSDPKALPYLRTSDSTASESEAYTRNSNACLQFDGDPFGFMNRLTAYPDYANIMAAKTSEIANLQPLIRIFKITSDDDGVMEQLEIPFDSHFTKKDLEIFRDNTSRGTGIGIKDFTFAYEGDNPFAVKKSISAKLTMHANNFTELLRTRYVKNSSNQVEEFKFVDLALKTGVERSLSPGSFDPNNRDMVEQNLDKLNFRLKVVVGWNYRDGWGSPTHPEYSLNTISPGVRSALYDSYITLNLTPVIHEFDIDDQGRVKFIINYLAYVEDFFDSPAFNIFPNTTITNADALPPREDRIAMESYTEGARVVRDLKLQIYSAKCRADSVSAIKGELAEEVEVYRVESLRSLMRDMIFWEKIRYLNLTADDVYQFRRSGPRWEGINDALIGANLPRGSSGSGLGIQTWEDDSALTGTLSAEIVEQVNAMSLEEDEKQARLRAIAATAADTQIQPVTFFYISDLVDIIFRSQAEKYDPNLDRGIIKQLEALKADPTSLAGFNFSTGLDEEIIDATIIRFQKMGEQLKNMRVLLGPLELVHQGNMQISTFPSIGDIPISVKYFIEWLSNKMSNRDEVYYSLPKFLNDLVNDLIRDVLNDPRCFRNQAKQRMRLAQASVTSYKVDTGDDPEEYVGAISHRDVDRGDKLDEITADILRRRHVDGFYHLGRMNTATYERDDAHYPLPVLEVSPNRGNPVSEEGVENEINWMIYYAGRTAPTERMTGNQTQDANVGIFHYTIGKDRGITKKIKLKKTDSNGLKELRFEQEGYDGLKQLREVFDVDIECYANVHAFPGQYIFVDPKGWAPNAVMDGSNFDLTQIGIGGYHMIVRSEHSFGPGYANSKIHAKWVASTHATVTNGPLGSEDDSETIGEDQPSFCFAAEDRAAQRQQAAMDAAMEELHTQDDVPIEDRNWLGWFNYVNPDAYDM